VETEGGMQKKDQVKNLTQVYVCSTYILKSTTAPQIFVVKNTLKIDVII
jgi:hypothetical protein